MDKDIPDKIDLVRVNKKKKTNRKWHLWEEKKLTLYTQRLPAYERWHLLSCANLSWLESDSLEFLQQSGLWSPELLTRLGIMNAQLRTPFHHVNMIPKCSKEHASNCAFVMAKEESLSKDGWKKLQPENWHLLSLKGNVYGQDRPTGYFIMSHRRS